MLKSGVVPILLLIAASVAQGAPAMPNVLLICIDDLRPELGCYGVDYIRTPHIDRLAAGATLFERHYVQAPTCGASRYALLTGTYGPPHNSALFNRAQRAAVDPDAVFPSLPGWFRTHGYTTVSVGKISHHPGGLGGPDWNDPEAEEMPSDWTRSPMPAGPWQHPRGVMHALANGEIRDKADEMDVYQSVAGPDTIYPDGLITQQSRRELRQLAADDRPFFLAVGLIRPHLPFGAPARYLEPYAEADLPPIPHPHKPAHRSTWHPSGEFKQYHRWGKDPNLDATFALEVRRHYAACVSYADAQVGLLLDELEAAGVADETVVVLWGDHGWHLGEHAVWGKHTLFEESLHAPLILRRPGGDASAKRIPAVVETIDLFPTLCDLANLAVPDALDGRSIVPLLDDRDARGRGALSYHDSAVTLRSDTHRLIVHRDGGVELYDHIADAGETRNVAHTEPDRVVGLAREIHARAADKLPEDLLSRIVAASERSDEVDAVPPSDIP